jgi:hypothetical protein
MAGLEYWFDNSGGESVPSVDSSDLKKVWTITQDILARDGANRGVAIGQSAYTTACSPGSNPAALWYRVSMLKLLADQLAQLPPEMPSEVMDTIFDVASTFPMKRMQVGVEYDQPPMDIQEFTRQIENELRKRGYRVTLTRPPA